MAMTAPRQNASKIPADPKGRVAGKENERPAPAKSQVSHPRTTR